MNKTFPRIGIYAGTFDPVHAGHVSFALYAQQVAHLDSVYFLPERKPRYKPHVQHFAHRVKMISEAIKPYPSMGIIELVDAHFSVKRTMPALKAKFGDSQLDLRKTSSRSELDSSELQPILSGGEVPEGTSTTEKMVLAERNSSDEAGILRKPSQLVYLFGSDVFLHIPSWPYANVLAQSAEFVVSVRKNDNVGEIEKIGQEFTGKKDGIIILDSLYPDVSSKQIRDALGQNIQAPGSLDSVKKYALKEWLYIRSV